MRCEFAFYFHTVRYGSVKTSKNRTPPYAHRVYKIFDCKDPRLTVWCGAGLLKEKSRVAVRFVKTARNPTAP